jgi:hypothetical protein
LTNLPDPTQTADSLTGAVLQLVRDHGLVVFAIAALIWQVWFLGSLLQANEERWRETITTLRNQIREDAEIYDKATSQLAAAVAGLTEISRANETIISAVERECIREQTVNELRKGAAP